MSDMKDFFFAIFEELPTFLMADPIRYFISIAVAIYVAALMISLFNFTTDPIEVNSALMVDTGSFIEPYLLFVKLNNDIIQAAT